MIGNHRFAPSWMNRTNPPPGARVTVTLVPFDQFNTKLSLLIASGTQPDLFGFGPLLRLLSVLWDESAAKNGCGLDPNGHCTNAVPQPPTYEGCGLDPNGCPRS